MSSGTRPLAAEHVNLCVWGDERLRRLEVRGTVVVAGIEWDIDGRRTAYDDEARHVLTRAGIEIR